VSKTGGKYQWMKKLRDSLRAAGVRDITLEYHLPTHSYRVNGAVGVELDYSHKIGIDASVKIIMEGIIIGVLIIVMGETDTLYSI
jgi:hypothetical protein